MARATRTLYPLWRPRGERVGWGLLWTVGLAALSSSLGFAVAGTRGALALTIAALALSATFAWRGHRARRAGSLVLHDGTLRRHDARGTGDLLVSRGELLGLTLLTDTAERSALLVLTTPSRVRILPIDVQGADDLRLLADKLPPVESGGHGPHRAALLPRDAQALIDALLAEFPHASERLYMRGARGESISVDRHELQVDGGRISLEQPLEVRTFAFFEKAGHLVSAYQAAWVRQQAQGSWNDELPAAPQEHVFVAALPGDQPRTWPVLEQGESAPLLRAPRHAVDTLLFSSLQRRIAGARAPQPSPSRRSSAMPVSSARDN